MTDLEKLESKWNTGLPIFKKLFEKNSLEIKTIVAKIFESRNIKCNDFNFRNCAVEKTSRNDEPREIDLHFYDLINIYPLGICFVPEHGSSQMVVTFDETFQFPEGV